MLRFSVLAGLLIALPLWAGEHLEPEESRFQPSFSADYYDMVVDYFRGAYANNVSSRLLVMPSFSNEYVVALREVGREVHIFYHTPTLKLWNYTYSKIVDSGAIQVMGSDGEFVKDESAAEKITKGYPKSYRDIPKVSCSRPISNELARDIDAVWLAMLSDVRYPEKPTLGEDGTTYHFSTAGFATFYGHYYAGQVWSPSPDTNPGRLVEISDLMIDFCKLGKAETLAELVAKTADLKKRVVPPEEGDESP